MTPHPARPVALELKAALEPGPIHDRLRAVLGSIREVSSTRVVAWRTSLVPDEVISGDARELLALAADAGPAFLGAEVEFDRGIRLLVSQEEECVFLSVRFPQPCERVAPRVWHVCGALADQDLIQSAVLERVADPIAHALPDLPLVRRATHMSAATVDLIEEHVGPLAAVLALPWQHVERHGETLLLGRGFEALDSADFMAAVYGHHLALATMLGLGDGRAFLDTEELAFE